jgi:hypothetical protein
MLGVLVCGWIKLKLRHGIEQPFRADNVRIMTCCCCDAEMCWRYKLKKSDVEEMGDASPHQGTPAPPRTVESFSNFINSMYDSYA